MFAPEGYWTWRELMDAVDEWALDYTIWSRFDNLTDDVWDRSYWSRERLLKERLLLDEVIDDNAEFQFALGVSGLWMLANFIDNFGAVMCSPNGITQRWFGSFAQFRAVS